MTTCRGCPADSGAKFCRDYFAHHQLLVKITVAGRFVNGFLFFKGSRTSEDWAEINLKPVLIPD